MTQFTHHGHDGSVHDGPGGIFGCDRCDQDTSESRLVGLFRAWLDELDPRQLAALAANWDNVMSDAALDRIDSWVIATAAIAELRKQQE